MGKHISSIYRKKKRYATISLESRSIMHSIDKIYRIDQEIRQIKNGRDSPEEYCRSGIGQCRWMLQMLSEYGTYNTELVSDGILNREEKSKELLMGTEMSVTEVAYAAGFSDSSYFIQCFRKYEGITPGEYGKC